MQLRKANRQAVKLKIGFSGPSGSGKTLSALRVAYGLTGNWDKIAVIDTENGSGELYTGMEGMIGAKKFVIGEYNYLPLTNFAPETYIQAIAACEEAGMEVIIIDSITHEWDYLLDAHSKMSGNSFSNWAFITPRHTAFKQKIMQSPCHIFTTVRRKQEYELAKDEKGKTTVQKLGTKEQTREGWDYEVTVNFEIEQNHYAKANKDRTNLFSISDPFVLDEEVGENLRDWSQKSSSESQPLIEIAKIDIGNAVVAADLNAIFLKYPTLKTDEDFLGALRARKAELISPAVQ